MLVALLFPALPEGAHAEEPATATPRAIEDPTVSLSVPATIEFADVMATPSGATTTAFAKIGVTTTASAGYKLYVYAEDNSLKSLNPQIQETITATAQTLAVEELDNNTWGYNLIEGTTAGTTFAALPTSDAAPATEKDTSATGGTTGDTYTLALGAKVDSTMPSGTYSVTMTVAAVADPAGVVVTYDANGGYFNGDTNWTSDPIAYMVVEGSDPTPSSEVMTPTRPGYVFWGWYKDAAGSWKNDFEVTPSVQSGTVYAKWLLDVGPIQNYTSDQCATQASTTEVAATDSRGGVDNVYSLRYINGTCWMTTNLRAASGTQLTSADSNLPDGITYIIPAADLTEGSSYTEGRVHAGEPSNGESATDTGYWYNYCAASAGEVCSSSRMQDATQDICPKGWSLPNKDQIDGLGGTTYLSAFAPVTGGIYWSNGTLYDTGRGYWWSSTANDYSGQYRLTSNGSSLGIGGYFGKDLGYYVRCVRSS